jgi:small subunit ribosomal protein S9
MSNKNLSVGIGRRKTSTAVVSLGLLTNNNSDTPIVINGKSGDAYFQYNFNYLRQIKMPLETSNVLNEYSIEAKIHGGGLSGQAEALRLGIARALCALDAEKFRSNLKAEGLLTRDARIKERRKYGLKKARKASQFSKR